jgi:hypothetical protein
MTCSIIGPVLSVERGAGMLTTSGAVTSFLADASAAERSSAMQMPRQLWFAGADLLFSTSSA